MPQRAGRADEYGLEFADAYPSPVSGIMACRLRAAGSFSYAQPAPAASGHPDEYAAAHPNAFTCRHTDRRTVDRALHHCRVAPARVSRWGCDDPDGPG